MKRAYTPRDITSKKYECIPWTGKWYNAFGAPTLTETWFICGASASGKSSFVMQLAKRLCEYGTVLYMSYEEGMRKSFCERMEREHMNEVQGRFRVAVDDSLDELIARLAKPKSPHFVIIDSFQAAYWTYAQVEALIKRFYKKSFIFVSQEYKGQPLGKAAVRLKYLAGVKVRTNGFRAYCQGRFTGDAGSSYIIWEEGVLRTTNNII